MSTARRPMRASSALRTSNPRHAHEWEVFRDRAAEIPDSKILVPGVVDRMIRVPDAASVAGARFLSDRLGRRVGASTGTNIVGVAAMVREIKSSPMLFGYRGGEVVDVEEVERLILRVAQLQHDLPQVSSMDLSLVLAGADSTRTRPRRSVTSRTRDP